MSNVLNVVRQNLLNINQLKQNSQSYENQLQSLEDKVNNLTELLNSHIASQQSSVPEEPAVEEPAVEEPVAEEGNLNLEVQ